MRIRQIIAGTVYTFVDPAKAQAAADGLRANAERYAAKSRGYAEAAVRLQAALDDALAKDEAKRQAKKDAAK